MRHILINTLYTGLRWYVSTGLFDRLATLVRNLITVDIPGPEKRAKVIDFAEAELGLIRDEVNSLIIDAVIAVTRLQHHQPDAPHRQ